MPVQGRSGSADGRSPQVNTGFRPLRPSSSQGERAVVSFGSQPEGLSHAETLLGQAMRVRSISAMQAKDAAGVAQLRKSAPGLAQSTGGGSTSSAARVYGSASQLGRTSLRRSADAPVAPATERFAQRTAPADAAAVPGRLQARGGDRPGTPANSQSQPGEATAWRRLSSSWASGKHTTRGSLQRSQLVKQAAAGAGADGAAARSLVEKLGGTSQSDQADGAVDGASNSSDMMRPITRSSPELAQASSGMGAAHRKQPTRGRSRRNSLTSHTASTASKARRSKSQSAGLKAVDADEKSQDQQQRAEGRRAASPAATARRHTIDSCAASSASDAAGASQSVSGRRSPSGHASMARTEAGELQGAIKLVTDPSGHCTKRATSSTLRSYDELSEAVDWEGCVTGAGHASKSKGAIHVTADVEPRRGGVLRRAASLPGRVWAPYEADHDAPGRVPLGLSLLRESRSLLNALGGSHDWAALLSVCSSDGSFVSTSDGTLRSCSPVRA
jgi:hypothetical protein